MQVWHELRNILMVMILLMLYLVLWVPYIVMVKGDQVLTKYKKFQLEVGLFIFHWYIDRLLTHLLVL